MGFERKTSPCPLDITVRPNWIDLMRFLVSGLSAEEGRLHDGASIQFPKIKPGLGSQSIVYLRQSSEKQVRQNKESQLLFSMTCQAHACPGLEGGGRSSTAIWDPARPCFGLVAKDRARSQFGGLRGGGIVGSREVSRLSRTDKDWCRFAGGVPDF